MIQFKLSALRIKTVLIKNYKKTFKTIVVYVFDSWTRLVCVCVMLKRQYVKLKKRIEH